MAQSCASGAFSRPLPHRDGARPTRRVRGGARGLREFSRARRRRRQPVGDREGQLAAPLAAQPDQARRRGEEREEGAVMNTGRSAKLSSEPPAAVRRQTTRLLLLLTFVALACGAASAQEGDASQQQQRGEDRSEERRVGKECRSRWTRAAEKKIVE